MILCLVTFVSSASSVAYHTLTMEDGLPTNAVLSVFKDHIGLVWIGTENGLARFDGNDIVKYPNTAKDEIWAIEELDDEILLYGTVSQLKSFNRRTNELNTIPLPASFIRAIKKIGTNVALIGSDNGLYLFNNGKTERIHIDSGISLANEITGIAKGKESDYWLSSADGLINYNSSKKTSTVYRMEKNGEKTNYFTCLTVDGDKIYLGGFNQGLFLFDVPSKQFSEIKGFEHNLIQTVDVVGDNLYIGTNGRGLITYSLSSGATQSAVIDKNRNNSLKSNTITSFLHNDGIQWVGTQFGGISYTPNSEDKFSIFRSRNFNSADFRVTAFYKLSDGGMLIGTRDRLFYVDSTGLISKHFTIQDSNSGLRSEIITYIDKIGDNILIGTYGGGIHIFDRSTLSIKDFSSEDLFRYGCVFQFIPDGKGDMWIATQEGLYLASQDGKVKKHYNHINSALPTSIVRRIVFDSNNRLWIGTKFGLVLLDLNSGKMSVDPLDIPKRDHIHNIYCDSKGNMFLCGSHGLSIIDPQLHILHHIENDEWLNGARPMSVLEIGPDKYWIATESEVVEYMLKANTVYKYQRQDGLPSMSFNFNSGIVNDSMVYLTNEGGLVYTDLRNRVKKIRTKKKPIIVSCVYNDTIVDFLNLGEHGAFVIPPDVKDVSFRVSNMNYALPYSNTYEYKLDGYDKEWRTLSGNNIIEYRNLPPGEYELFVRNSDNDETASTKVVVRRSYAKLLITIVMVLVFIVIILYFLHKIWKLQKRLRHERKIFASVKKSTEDQQHVSAEEESTANPLLEALLNYMGNEKPYLNPKLSIKEVAATLETSDIELSKLLHSGMNVNWATFVNTYRVNEVKRRIESGDLSRLTLNALSEKCGFGSKTSFYRVFKSIAGTTPSNYCKQLGINIDESE